MDEQKPFEETKDELGQAEESVFELKPAEESVFVLKPAGMKVDELNELSDTTLELGELVDTYLELGELSNTEDGAGLAAGRNGHFSVQGKVHKMINMGLILAKFDQPIPQSISSLSHQEI